MKTRFAPLSLYLFCSIGASHASYLSHTSVLDAQEPLMIKNPMTGQCIRMGDNDDIVVADCDQEWDLRPYRIGNFWLRFRGTTKCLNGSANFVEESQCDYIDPRRAEQLWIFTNDKTIQNKVTGKCMEVDRIDGKNFLTLAKCNDENPKPEQAFEMMRSDRTRRTQEHVIPVRDKSRCMKVGMANNDFVVRAGSCQDGSANWYFNQFTDQVESKYATEDVSIMCLDAVNGAGGEATISECDVNKKSQRWYKDSKTIKSHFLKNKCLKLNVETGIFEVKKCGDGDAFQFKYENAIRVSETE